jgi:hypothetical protein
LTENDKISIRQNNDITAAKKADANQIIRRTAG